MQDTLSMQNKVTAYNGYTWAMFANSALAKYRKCKHSGQRCYPSKTDPACVKCFEEEVNKFIDDAFSGEGC